MMPVMNTPTLFTVARMVLIPIFILVYIIPGAWSYPAAAALFAIAALTDWLDGYLARRLNQTTRFGAFLDPVADKLIVVAALVLLIGSHGNLLLSLAGVVIIGREIVISALREWMAEMNRRGVIAVSWLGKVKTTVQIIATIVLLAFPPDLSNPLVWVGYVLIYVAAGLTLWSMVLYLKAAWPTLRSGLRPDGGSGGR
jgi:CDP-diacylglycerol---glycerol-3-phosphate 3-phosphatidyltransferase